jgi:hypothetical protein
MPTHRGWRRRHAREPPSRVAGLVALYGGLALVLGLLERQPRHRFAWRALGLVLAAGPGLGTSYLLFTQADATAVLRPVNRQPP